jgi:hypothetical protein
MKDFVWALPKGENEAAYMQRMFKEHPTLSIRDMLQARNHPVISNPVLVTAPILKVEAPRNDTRELELERENASLRLQVNRLTERLTMMQRMCAAQHKEMLNAR